MQSTVASRQPDLLATIVAATKRIVEDRSARVPTAQLEAAGRQHPDRSGWFTEMLRPTGRVNIIAECKRRSPSRGVLRADYDAAAIAKAYQAAGAAAISVLTEPTFFDGALEHLRAAREAVDLPLLRKDFVISEYQLLEARACGADAVLLIVAALAQRDLLRLHRQAEEIGLDALVEVHDAAELDRALDAGAHVIGVNNRNLRTLEVDIEASEALITRIPGEVIAVSESGLKSADDVRRLRARGYRAFLVGERFMTASDPGAALKDLLCS